jgi:hypothetical protein
VRDVRVGRHGDGRVEDATKMIGVRNFNGSLRETILRSIPRALCISVSVTARLFPMLPMHRLLFPLSLPDPSFPFHSLAAVKLIGWLIASLGVA